MTDNLHLSVQAGQIIQAILTFTIFTIAGGTVAQRIRAARSAADHRHPSSRVMSMPASNQSQ